MTTTLEDVAYRMFLRNVADYAEPALAELAWIDRDIRSFWIQQAQAVAADLTDLAGSGARRRDNTHMDVPRGLTGRSPQSRRRASLDQQLRGRRGR